MNQNEEFLENELHSFTFTKKSSSQKKERIPQQTPIIQTQPQIVQSQVKNVKKKKNNVKDLNSIQEANFKYIWNFLKSRQESELIGVIDIAKAAQSVMKKPIEEELILEMLNIYNDSLYQDENKILNQGIGEEELRQIFIECKLKM
ncbi:unnamed protein product [Paramecium primaurelia]|uniref:Uncharacterized protein n=1 Tax=Paramecium primaurelia TaxID=5886 RepID=A0A8S1KKM1_PARPR|nr:unnamed protein product [Paramecium primaurelia]